MADILNSCAPHLRGWYECPDRIRINGSLLRLQRDGAIVNWMKEVFPDEQEPLRWFGHFTGRIKNHVAELVAQGVPFFDADPTQGKKYDVSDRPVQEWLDTQYASQPRAGSLVAIVRARECVRSFACRPRKHTRAKGNPKTGRRPRETAHHHVHAARHNIHVYYFFVQDSYWGRASVRIPSYLPFSVTLQLNAHSYVQRQLQQRGWQFEMLDNAVARVHDWDRLREAIGCTNWEREIRRFAGRWLKRLPHGLSQQQLYALGDYHWTIQVLECSLNYVFEQAGYCRPVFEQLLQHNLLVGSPESLRTLFDRKRGPARSSNQLTVAEPMRCLKAFWGPNWLKFYDKGGVILRFEMVFNDVTMFVANKSLSNLGHLLALGHNVCRRLERWSTTAAVCPIRARDHTLLEGVDDDHGRRFGGIRAERRAEQSLLAALFQLRHAAAGFSHRQWRQTHEQISGGPGLKTSQASYRLKKYRAHGLIEPVGKTGRRYQLTERGVRGVALLLKVHQRILEPAESAIRDGLRRLGKAVHSDAVDEALNKLFLALGLVAA